MAIKQPNIDIAFKQKAISSIEKSERGIAILILKNDETSGCPDYAVYKEVTEYETVKDKYNAENQKAITDVFTFPPSKVIVVNSDTVSNALIEIEKNIPTGWITVENGTAEDFATLTSWIKLKEAKKRTYKAITYNTTSTDCKHIANNTNPKVEFIDNRGKVDAIKYLPSLLGIAAYCGGNNRSMTYFKCTNLKSVEAFSDIDVELAKGNLVMFNDTDCVRICQGINTLITYDGETATEDMSFIETVETMDTIQDDIRDVFKETYLGPYVNDLDSQMLLISAINGYLKELSKVKKLDPNYNNIANINITAQRDAWVASGKAEAKDWDDAKVKNNTFKRDVFLAGDIKILGSMTNLKLDISLF
ncbi:phage tail sheath C-terminal domain-containing protein [Clostridium butyricum]|uniref:Tail sheath protein C-terminal domain-containing protein n=1 Tax=Clostridium butyricum E4 str. BoNT E BL5262 TaxID=632245 RepID=C4II28_CLOBU|nr:phage tail sheath C-terminal domain-containing protein [Clostridium butyricum]EDT75867.1 conserved hypothetical protein [Clostridium butyricum 5521]EEP54497.1 conserved hypothetical protein [Clostridium butyricum E4 str. BoNT E BL5262]NFL33222.1 phage tail sheath protein [Clostridium butyricum]NFS20416.1 phage tail sheath protein [Clostridium butyricum]